VQQLLDRSDAEVGCKDNCGRTALHHAARMGHKDTAYKLIAEVDVDTMDSNNKTALLTGLEANHLDVVRLLIAKDRVTLHALAKCTTWDPIQILLKAGYHVDIRDSRKSTPLHEAVRSKSKLVLAKLISSGADINLSNIDGKTPLPLAIDNRDCESIEQLLRDSAVLSGIMAERWHYAFNNTSDILVISECPKQGYSVDFKDPFTWPATQPEIAGKRLL
jgi:ankyrin repeat protein